ncbi:MAG: ABC transporter ATP-binding protein [Rhizobiaceae bacterium]|nr:ABC transporter ATP-binding protein [Rhizobiaceae bacterium]
MPKPEGVQEKRIAVEARGITKIFGAGENALRALDNVSVSIRQNEFFTLLGPSGCGKTTLLRLIAGFEYPSEGAILLDGTDIATLPPFKRPVNTVFQSYALFPHLTVAQNIAFGLEMLGKPRAEINARVAQMLKLVQMEELGQRRTDQISGGQAQRVALARALAPSPKVLLLDEPLSALDYKLRKEMQIELKRMQHETGITFIFVTHDQEEALTMSDRIAVMSKGKILQIGGPRDIYERPSDRFVANFIGETNFIDAEIDGATGGAAAVIARLPGGAQIAAGVPDGMVPRGRVAIVVRPEHAVLARPDEGGQLRGTVENVVYSGTDTHFHVRLDGGNPFVVRSQNRRGTEAAFAAGDPVAVRIQDGAAQVLRD